MSTTIVNIKLNFDGACRGNPGPGGWGAVIQILDSDQNCVQKITSSGPLGDLTTSNIAEYYGLLNGLRSIIKNVTNYSPNRMNLKICGDSELVIKQINGEYNVNDQNLKQFYTMVISILENFYNYECMHIGREQNEEADALAKAAAAQNRPALNSNQMVVFRPNICAVGKARIGNVTVSASNDFVAAGSSGVFLIDAYFLVETCGINVLGNLRDPHPIEICESKQLYNILGILRQNLRVRLWGNHSDTDDKSHEVFAKNVVVVHKLPVPFHFTQHASETRNLNWRVELGRGQMKCNKDAFEEPYCSHQYWNLDNVEYFPSTLLL